MAVDKSINFNPSQGQQIWSPSKKLHTFYQEYRPCHLLKDYVACYWYSKTLTLPDTPVQSRVIPDGCMDIILNMSGDRVKATICGIMTKPEITWDVRHREFLGIRFLPGKIIPFIRLSGAGLADQTIHLEDTWHQGDMFITEQIQLAKSLEEKLQLMENILLQKLAHLRQGPEVLEGALQGIYGSRGSMPVTEIARESFISQRQLGRIFKDYVGVSPKKFSNIVRFQHALQLLGQDTDIKLVDLAITSGYVDQPHFIKEFKAFYGSTPKGQK